MEVADSDKFMAASTRREPDD